MVLEVLEGFRIGVGCCLREEFLLFKWSCVVGVRVLEVRDLLGVYR